MSDLFYRADPFLICALLALALFIAGEAGFRVRGRERPAAETAEKSDISLILGGVLTLLSLMLGFTFVLSEERYEARRKLVIDESNAIGTTYLRAWTLPGPEGSEIRDLLRQYIDLRVQAAGTSTVTRERLDRLIAGTRRIHGALWARASSVARRRPTPVTSLFLQSLNQVIDINSDRLAAFRNRVPLSVYAVLFLVSIIAMWLVGYYSRSQKGRARAPAALLALLIASVMWLIMDLDQPLRGLIRPSQQSLADLQADLGMGPSGSSLTNRALEQVK